MEKMSQGKTRNEKISAFIAAVILISLIIANFIIFLWPYIQIKQSEKPYSENADITNYAWITFSKVSNDTSNRLDLGSYVTDFDPNTWFATQSFNISKSNPLKINFDWTIQTNCSGIRFYYYQPTGLQFCPKKYIIYADSVLIYDGGNTTPTNDTWTTIYFPNVTCKKLTWEIYSTYGNNPTQVVINDIEVLPTRHSAIIKQDAIPYFEEIPNFWNDLDWAISWHIDDVINPSSINLGWLRHQPITLAMMGRLISCPSSYVTKYHVEYASHSDAHTKKGAYGYNTWFNWIHESIQILEHKAPHISLWSNKCISFAVPFSSGNPHGAKAAYDAGIRIMGTYAGKSWKIRNPRNIDDNSTINYPRTESDWMFLPSLARQGLETKVGVTWKINLLQAKENKSYADMMMHPWDKFDEDYYSFIENDTTGWHCTWGEIRSYEWYRRYTNVTYNEIASTPVKKVFDVTVHNTDDRIWNVPVTFKFNIPGWNGSAIVRWQNNGTIYKNIWDNISGFYTSSSQHTNQTMREGYRWNGTILCLSTKLGGNKIIELGTVKE